MTDAVAGRDEAVAGDGTTVLDVRPVLARGEEPFRLIMGTVESLPAGGRLTLLAPFDPRPLHNVMAARGFRHEVREEADGFVVEYVPEGETAAAGAPAATGPADAGCREVVTLDVRGLTPPEPMERTLAALETLPAGACLEQLNDRIPAFLLPLLEERGFDYAIAKDARGTVTTVWRV
jgi:uncharacterized protein (DUF2249 family)